MIDLSRDWRDVPWHVIDVETSGRDPATCMPVELAVATFVRGRLINRYSILFNPGVEIEEEARAVHGLTDEDLAHAPAGALVGDFLRSALDLAPVEGYPVGYNGNHFDRTVLRRLDVFGTAVLEVDWIDPLVMVRDIDREELGSGLHRLGKACARRLITHEHAHRALGDAVATGHLLWALRNDVPFVELGALLDAQRIAASHQQANYLAWKARQQEQTRRGDEPYVVEET